jgi:general stress protein YciG
LEEKSKDDSRGSGRQGNLKTSATHGKEFHSEIGRKGGKIGGSKVDKASTNLFRN